MINFLLELGISQNTIELLEENQEQSNLYNLSCNKYEIEKIIKYFNEIGITCTEELLIDYFGLFFGTFNDIKTRFSRYNIKELVKLINENPDTITYIK